MDEDELTQKLRRGLDRAQIAIERAQKRHAELLDQATKQLAEPWLRELSSPVEFIVKINERRKERKLERKLERRRQRLLAKEARRQQKRELQQARLRNRSPIEGTVSLVAAVLMALFTVVHPDYWWLLFPALGIGTNGAQILGAHYRRREPVQIASPSTPSKTSLEPGTSTSGGRDASTSVAGTDPRDGRVDELCRRLLEELKKSPKGLRELVGSPEKTIEALRTTAHDLTRRERELRALLRPEDSERLERERGSLLARLGSAQDETLRQKVHETLAALERQREQNRQLEVAASRFEVEQQAITLKLEQLHAQLVLMRTGAATAEATRLVVRQSLEQLGDQIDAVAESIEAVNRGDLSPVGPVGSEAEGDASSPRAKDDRRRDRS